MPFAPYAALRTLPLETRRDFAKSPTELDELSRFSGGGLATLLPTCLFTSSRSCRGGGRCAEISTDATRRATVAATVFSAKQTAPIPAVSANGRARREPAKGARTATTPRPSKRRPLRAARPKSGFRTTETRTLCGRRVARPRANVLTEATPCANAEG